MQETYCPLCYGELEVRDVAPCDECGALQQELEHFAARKHSYAEYEVFPPLKLTLCNFCDVDFGSGDPTFFGLPRSARIGYQFMRLVQPIQERTSSVPRATFVYPFFALFTRRGSSMLANKPLVPTRNGEAPLLAAQRCRYA
jgi:hypothetical protein